MPPTIAEALRAAQVRLGGEAPRFAAECLLAHSLERDRAWLFAHADAPLPAAAAAGFEALLSRHVAGEPLAYLLGHRAFWTLELAVAPGVLIPRPETELLVEWALARLPTDSAAHIADLGTGSGAIALALASERRRAQVIATDLSNAALRIARANAERAGLGNVGFVRGDWCTALADRCFDLIVSNPPYIAIDDPHLARGDLRFEPISALVAGKDGLDAIRKICAAAPQHLRAGGWIGIEHGWQQGAAVRSLLGSAGFAEVKTLHDLEGRERISVGQARQGGANSGLPGSSATKIRGTRSA